LAALLAERADLAADRVRFLAVFEQVCQTLAYAHSKDVIHRDLKPSNVMVGAYGEVQVMDWGLAKVLIPGANEPASRERQRSEGISIIQTPREVDADSGQDGTETRAGSVLGTPGYIAPEQARGEVEDVDQRADVFGLGAILCEVLTGKPPFPGASDAALKKARRGDLEEAFARLDGCGADAELIALAKRCLAAKPEERPRDAGETAAAVTAYRESVEHRLRQAEVANAEAKAKAEEGRKRRRLMLALAGSVLLTVLAMGGAWLWAAQDRQARRTQAERAADVALGKAEQAAEQARKVEPETPEAAGQALALWRQSRESIEEAERILAASGAEEARGRAAARRQETEAGLNRAEKEARLLNDLDRARAVRANSHEGGFDLESGVRAYAAALEVFGLDVSTPEAESATAIRNERPAIRLALIVALDDWAGYSFNKTEVLRLHRIADQADGDDWRRRYRAASDGDDLAKLKSLAEEARQLELPAVSAHLLARALKDRGARAEAAALLRQARRQHPADFWVYYDLGACLFDATHPDQATQDEAEGAFWAALALRPGSAPTQRIMGLILHDKGDLDGEVACYRKAIALDPKDVWAYVSLGRALYGKKDLNGAIAAYRKAIDLDPKYAWAHFNLGDALHYKGDRGGAAACYRKAIELDPRSAPARNALGMNLYDQGDWDGATACYRKAIELDPKYAWAHSNLGGVLSRQGDQMGAAVCCRKAIALDPKFAPAHTNLGNVLRAQGDLTGAFDCFKKAVELDPKGALAYYNLGVVLDEKGDQDGAIVSYRKAIELDPKLSSARENLGNALRDKGDWDGAIACFKKAIDLDPKNAKDHYGFGNALRDKGDWDGAIACFKKAIALDPKYAEAHCNLGQTLRDKGLLTESLDSYREGHRLGSAKPNWPYPSEQWVRQAERLVEVDKKFAAILEGKGEPADDAERLALAHLCQEPFKKLYAASCRFYSEAFAHDAKLADDMQTADRYNAACVAALAGRGQGADAGKLDDKEQARLRKQAIEWLRADLAYWTKQAASEESGDRERVRQALKHWQADSDLAGLCDTAELAKLPADEQEACKKLWADVQALLDKADGKK
jgi:eukaryotic-like serine/threonine-protein kinase